VPLDAIAKLESQLGADLEHRREPSSRPGAAAFLERRLGVKGGKTPYENMFSGLPQTADIGVAWCRQEIPLAAPLEPPSRVGGQAWTLRCDPRDQPPQRHGTSSGRAHVTCQTTRVAAFGLAAGFHIMSTADRLPRNVSLFGTWRAAIFLWVC
jgi:hypothetical protein